MIISQLFVENTCVGEANIFDCDIVVSKFEMHFYPDGFKMSNISLVSVINFN